MIRIVKWAAWIAAALYVTGLLPEVLATLDARLIAQILLLRAQHVQPAANAALEPLVGEVEMGLRVVAGARVEVEHAAARDNREVRLPGRDRNLPLDILHVLLRDHDLIPRLVTLRPRDRRQNGHAEIERGLRLHTGHNGRRASSRVELHGVGEVGREGRIDRRKR